VFHTDSLLSFQFSSVDRKNMVIPKYAGYVPQIRANSLMQKRITEQSRDVLTKDNIDEQEQTMASTGFNPIHIPKQDDTLISTSRFHGGRTLPNTHPANHSNYSPRETTFRASYRNPNSLPREVWRNRNRDQEFSGERTLEPVAHVTDKTNLYGPRMALINNCSGYVMNATLWDSTSWNTEENLHTDQMRTQYRKQFNQPKPFHNRAIKHSTGRLPRLLATYEPADMTKTGFSGKSYYPKKDLWGAMKRRNLNYRRFEENGKNLNIDC